MPRAVWLRVALIGLALGACVPSPTKPAPKEAPEPPQASPSAAALGPVRIDEPICQQWPSNGEVLEGATSPEGNHFYDIENTTGVPAIVKLRRGNADGPLVVAVFLGPNKTAQIGPLEDGTYRMTYAMGGALAPDCRHFDFAGGYGQYDKSETFVTKYEGGRLVGRTANLGLDESDVDGGSGAQALSAEKFNAP